MFKQTSAFQNWQEGVFWTMLRSGDQGEGRKRGAFKDNLLIQNKLAIAT
ncbi:hypothetical protein SAMN05216327_1268 [Dyadobacter sp. SG02]|nr:hypothetical protein SAMN05216327_1268 [Dyadobacter sp. SG02]